MTRNAERSFQVQDIISFGSGNPIFAMGTTPPWEVGDPVTSAPVGSEYVQSNGSKYRKVSVGDLEANWEILSVTGATRINELIDVNVPSPALGDVLYYDGDRFVPVNELFRIASKEGIIAFLYDTQGRVSQKIIIYDFRRYRVRFAYDAQGRLSTRTFQTVDGLVDTTVLTETFVYDEMGRVLGRRSTP